MNNQLDLLLKEIQDISSCLYLSDLPQLDFSPYAKLKINQIPEDRYELEEWNQVASYITSIPCSFSTIQAAKEQILKNRT